MTKLFTIALLSSLGALFQASPASACTCAGETAFDGTARRADVVVTGRVTSIGELRYDDDPQSIDVDVEWVGKGGVTASSIRVWNVLAGTSCGGAFKEMKPGSLVALALSVVRASDDTSFGDPAIDELLVRPVAGDFEVLTGCSEGHKVFRTKRDRDRWIARALK